jgi:hypothetical protein
LRDPPLDTLVEAEAFRVQAYIATDPSSVGLAFQQIKSEILRLAQQLRSVVELISLAAGEPTAG